LAAISSLFQRGNPSLSSYKHRFQASIFHLHTVRWLQAKKASSEHVRTNPRSSIRAKSLPTTGSYTRRRSHVRLPRNFPAGPSEASSLGNPDAGERFGKIFDDGDDGGGLRRIECLRYSATSRSSCCPTRRLDDWTTGRLDDWTARAEGPSVD
jgi:hypothetical protein